MRPGRHVHGAYRYDIRYAHVTRESEKRPCLASELHFSVIGVAKATVVCVEISILLQCTIL